MTCMLGPCAHRTGSAWGAAAAPPFFPPPAAPSSVGGRGAGTLPDALRLPLGGGGSCPTRAADVAAAAPPEPSPVGWGSVGSSCPPREEESATPRGRPVPTPGAV